jgi:hypothetical protein
MKAIEFAYAILNAERPLMETNDHLLKFAKQTGACKLPNFVRCRACDKKRRKRFPEYLSIQFPIG